MHYFLPSAFSLWVGLILILFLGWALKRYRQRTLEKYTSPELISQLIFPRSPLVEKAKMGVLCFCWLLAVWALAGPYGNIHYTADKTTLHGTQVQAEPIIFVVDTSASMSVKDIDQRSRLEAAKEIIQDMLSRLNGHPLSLYTFTTILNRQVPLTYDDLFFRMVLDQIQINEGGAEGTDISAALSILSVPEGSIVILFSDGGEKELMASPLPIFAVGVGTVEGGHVPGAQLKGQPVKSKLEMKFLTQLTNKTFSTAKDPFRLIGNKLAETIQSNGKLKKSSLDLTKENLLYDLYFQIPLGIAFILLCLFIALSEGRNKKLSTLLLLGIQLHLCADGDAAINQYNLGTEALQSENWSQAAAHFNQVPILSAPSSRFVIYYKINSALAKLNLAEEPLSDPSYAKYLLQQALVDLDEVRKADCLWFSCHLSAQLDEWIQEIHAQRETIPPFAYSAEKHGQEPQALIEGAIVSTHKAIEANIGHDKVEEKQKKVIENLKSFTSVLQQWEEKDFNKNMCQAQPWEQVMPFIDKGYNSALLANDLIIHNRATEAIEYQNITYIYLQQALKALKKGRGDKQPSTYSGSAEKTLNDLKEMYKEDLPRRPAPSQEIHAW